MDGMPFLLCHQGYSVTLPRKSLDFQNRMSSIFGERAFGDATSSPKIIILSRTDDCEADAVGLELASRGVPYLRLDADMLPDRSAFNLHTESGITGLSITSSERSASELNVVWLRHFDASAMSYLHEDPIVRSFIQSEWTLAIRGLLLAEGAFWINHPDIVHSMDRISQLRLAHSVGMETPRTLVSNDPERIGYFFDSCQGVIAKVLGDHLIESVPGKMHGVFPHVVTDADLVALRGTTLAPSIYQEYLADTTEIRATVIGQRIIAVEVGKTGSANVWEQPDDVLVREHTLPASVEKALLTYMRLAGLRYGAFDFLLTEDDRYVFLEVNLKGDWTWLEARHDQLNITGAMTSYIVELLEAQRHDG